MQCWCWIWIFPLKPWNSKVNIWLESIHIFTRIINNITDAECRVSFLTKKLPYKARKKCILVNWSSFLPSFWFFLIVSISCTNALILKDMLELFHLPLTSSLFWGTLDVLELHKDCSHRQNFWNRDYQCFSCQLSTHIASNLVLPKQKNSSAGLLWKY